MMLPFVLVLGFAVDPQFEQITWAISHSLERLKTPA